jgi:hypothetical protein
MKVFELLDWREALDMQGWIAVPRGSLWQKEIVNIWVFPSHEAAQDAAWSSAMAPRVISKLNGGYLAPITTLNNVELLVAVTDKGFHEMKDFPKFHVYAYSVTEKSCRAAAEKAMNEHGITLGHSFDRGDNIWCYKTYNSDPDFFSQEDDE